MTDRELADAAVSAGDDIERVKEALEYLHGFEEAPDGDAALAAFDRLQGRLAAYEQALVKADERLAAIYELASRAALESRP